MLDYCSFQNDGNYRIPVVREPVAEAAADACETVSSKIEGRPAGIPLIDVIHRNH